MLNAFKQEISEKNNIKNKFLIIIPPIFQKYSFSNLILNLVDYEIKGYQKMYKLNIK